MHGLFVGSDVLFVRSWCAVVIRGCVGGAVVGGCCVMVAVLRVASVGSTAAWDASIGFSAWGCRASVNSCCFCVFVSVPDSIL